MSELTLCNRCTLTHIEHAAAEDGLIVTRLPKPLKGGKYSLPRGEDLFVHPPHIVIEELPPTERETYFRVWFAELSDACCC